MKQQEAKPESESERERGRVIEGAITQYLGSVAADLSLSLFLRSGVKKTRVCGWVLEATKFAFLAEAEKARSNDSPSALMKKLPCSALCALKRVVGYIYAEKKKQMKGEQNTNKN